MKSYDPWAEQPLLDAAIEKGKVYACPKTTWKFRLRYVTPWSKYAGRATSIVYARPEVQEISRKRGANQALTPAEEEVIENAHLEIAIRSTLISWSSNVTGRDRKPLEMTIANAMTLARGLPWLWHEMQAFAMNPASFGLVAAAPTTSVPDGVDARGNSSDTSDSQSEDSTVS